eukprot:GHVQ01003361.1.p1 GENE.GHVQ01003361.1~~GHVQ01003361.1.p1  ORF type:complete len:500 (-),score=128.19 GHVQ01003361.1:101-1600(-)
MLLNTMVIPPPSSTTSPPPPPPVLIGGTGSYVSTNRTRSSITVWTPATSANLGPGFDCIGLALDIWNIVTVSRSKEFSITVEGEGEDELPRDNTNLVVVGVESAFHVAGITDIPPMTYHCMNKIPFAMGLGSSSAAIVGGLVAGLGLLGLELPVQGREAMLNIACRIEGHPDNVAPAIYGGMQVGVLINVHTDDVHTDDVHTDDVHTDVHRNEQSNALANGQTEGPTDVQANGKANGQRDVQTPPSPLSSPPHTEISTNKLPPSSPPSSSPPSSSASSLASISPPSSSFSSSSPSSACASSSSAPSSSPSLSPSSSRWYTTRLNLFAGLQCVLFVPDLSLNTSEARGVLPALVSREAAVFNAGRCALLVNAFSTGNMSDLRHAMQDQLHQPARATAHFPHLTPIIQAALSAGAHGACLSGAGPAVLAITSGAKGDIQTQIQEERIECRVAQSIIKAVKVLGLNGRLFITRPTERGAHITSSVPSYGCEPGVTVHRIHDT